MPEQNRDVPVNPDQSGTGQGALTAEQQRFLAELWWVVKKSQDADDYATSLETYHNVLTPDERARWQHGLDERYARDPQGYWDRVAESLSIGADARRRGGRGNAGGYAFPQVPPQAPGDPSTGESPFGGQAPDYSPPDSHGGFDRIPDWMNNPDVLFTKAAKTPPAVAAVAASLFVRMKLDAQGSSAFAGASTTAKVKTK